MAQQAARGPILELDERGNTKFTDLYVQPVRLGWNRSRSDFLAGLGIFAPTGDYEFRGDSNSGLGMWSFELFAGATAYFGEKKTLHFSTTAFYETHTEKKDTEIDVGDILTLEGGLGVSPRYRSHSRALEENMNCEVTRAVAGSVSVLTVMLAGLASCGGREEPAAPIQSKGPSPSAAAASEGARPSSHPTRAGDPKKAAAFPSRSRRVQPRRAI